MHLESVDALLFLNIPNFNNTVDRSRSYLHTHVDPRGFDKLVLVPLESSQASLFIFISSGQIVDVMQIPRLNEHVSADTHKLFIDWAELNIPHVLAMASKLREEFQIL